MVEFYACLGLACFNADFFADISQDDEDAAAAAVNNWLFRLSCGEFRDLRAIVRDPQVAEELQELREKFTRKRLARRALRCRPPAICH